MTNSLLKTVTSCLVEQLFQLECADEDQVNEDFSVSLMEVVGAELQSLSADDLSKFLGVVTDLLESEEDTQRREYLEGLAENFGLDQNTV